MRRTRKPLATIAWPLLLALLLAGCAAMQESPKPASRIISSFPGMRLLGDGAGWFFQGGAYRTLDGGRHWQDMTPADLGDSRYFTGFALDRKHVWLVSSVPRGMRLYRSSDGGENWKSIPLINQTGPAAIQFSDAQHGNILLGLDKGIDHEAVALFTTADGGRTWTEVAGTRPGYFQGPLMIGPLNDLCCVGAVTFRNAKDGWITGSYSLINKVYLQHSADGGRRWLDQVLPLQPDEESASSDVSVPIFFGDQEAVLAVGFTWSQGKRKGATRVVIFHSSDGGQSWQRGAALDRRETGTATRPLISFINPRDGWLRWGSVLYRTRDGGQRWKPVTLNLVDPWTSLQFVNGKTGWVESLHAILATRDGGQSWQPLNMP